MAKSDTETNLISMTARDASTGVSGAQSWKGAHDNCPVTGECIEAMGGQINRFYLARTPGFTDLGVTIETVAERWQEVVSRTAERISLHTQACPREWSPKPYVPVA